MKTDQLKFDPPLLTRTEESVWDIYNTPPTTSGFHPAGQVQGTADLPAEPRFDLLCNVVYFISLFKTSFRDSLSVVFAIIWWQTCNK